MPLSVTTLKQRNIFILVIILILAFVILFGLQRIMSGILGSVIIYLIFRPLNVYIREKRKWNPNLTTLLIMILSLVCLIIPIFFLVKLITDKVIYYVSNPEMIEGMVANIRQFAVEKLNQPDLIDDTINGLKDGAGNFAYSIVNGAANTFIQLIVMYFILFYVIKYFREFEKGLVQYLPLKKSNSVLIGHEFRNMTYSNILGQGLIAIIQGTLLGIGFLIFGIPDPVFWAMIGTFLCMIPLFGSPLIFIPAGLIEISNGNLVSGFGIIIYGYLIVTTIDNFIRMAIGRKIANTHPLITIVGVVIGIPIFGILGILYGPLMISLFIILVKIYNTNKTEIAVLQGEEE